MFYQKILNLRILQEIVEVFNRLNCLRRWTSVTSDGRYNELAKQMLNCIIAGMLAIYVEAQGKSIIWERFPKIALYRAFQKSYVYFDTPEHIIDEICSFANIHKDAFNKATTDIIKELTNEDFSTFICEGIGTYEMEIYRAATKIATLVELEENAPLMRSVGEYTDKLREIEKSIARFEHIPGVLEFSDMHGEYFKIFTKISKLRNQNRWAVQPYLVNCSVSGHLFTAGTLNYFIKLEECNNEKLATEFFFKGLSHDIPEVWTTDFPSPIKNRIPGFRPATKEYETIVLERYLYHKLPEFMAIKLRSVMNEDENSASYKLLKGGDYLSADLECWLQYLAGSRHPYFLEAIKGFDKGLENGTYILPPICRQLHDYVLRYSQNVVKQFEI